MESVNKLESFRFPFSKLRYGPFGFNQGNFANVTLDKLNEMK